MTHHIFQRRATQAECDAVLARIRLHCEAPLGDGGCWLWRGAWSGSRPGEGGRGGGRAVISFRGRPMPVRHVVYFLAHRQAPPPGKSICACGVRDCVSPACVQATSRAEAAQIAARMGVYSHPQANQNRKAAAQARVHYDEATVAQVRLLPGSAHAVARVTGMSKAHVSNIRAGRARRPADAPPPLPRATRQQSALRRAAASAAVQARTVFLARLQSARDVAGIWSGLLP